jgi:hypothetical protein
LVLVTLGRLIPKTLETGGFCLVRCQAAEIF